jgi:hypothetical protein
MQKETLIFLQIDYFLLNFQADILDTLSLIFTRLIEWEKFLFIFALCTSSYF